MYAIKRLQAQRWTWYWQVSYSRGGKRYERRFYEPKHGVSSCEERHNASGGTRGPDGKWQEAPPESNASAIS